MIENDELFDPNLLEQTVVSLIGEGKRNFAINLSNVDYLYSDSINKFINLNHRVLNVYGRLALLAPGTHLMQILQRAGIQNFLRIYSNEDDLIKASEEIIEQTTALNIKDVKAHVPEEKEPLSEFEDLRSEIGKAIEPSAPEEKTAPEEIFQADSAFTIPPQTFTPEVDEVQKSDFVVSEEPKQTPPPYEEIVSEGSQTPQQFQDFTEQPVQTPPPVQPILEAPAKFDTPPEAPPVFEAPPQAPPKFEAPPEVPPKFEAPPEAPPKFEAPPEVPPKFEARPEVPPDEKIAPPMEGEIEKGRIIERERFIEEEPEELVKKKSPVGMILVILILILVIGGGAFYLFNPFKQKDTQPVTKAEQPITQEIPQIEVEEEEVIEEKEVEEKKAPVKPVTKVKPRRKRPVKKVTPAPVKKPKPTPKKPVVKPSVPDRLTITSYPTNAKVIIEGREKGNTPYTWNKPTVYGQVKITVKKSGYVSKKLDVRYRGGTVKKHFVLAQAPVAPKPKPSPTKPTVTTPKPTPPEPVTTTKPTPKPTPKPTTGGAAGTIFISSLPPMADVYMDGKLIGKTNIDKLKVTAGTHTMKFAKGDKQLTKQMTFKAGENPSQLIRIK